MSCAEEPTFDLKLFVAGATPRSLRAVSSVRRFCEARLEGRFHLNVIDVYADPKAARTHQIVALPTLLKLAPAPRRLFVGDMADLRPLARGLGLCD